MLKRCFALFAVVMMMSGCASFKYLDGSSEKELESYHSESPEKAKELASEVEELRGRLEDNERQISALEEQAALLNMQAGEVPVLREENERLASENEDLKNELSAAASRPEGSIGAVAETGEKEPPAVSVEALRQEKKKGAYGLPKIKVLTGTGDMGSADKMSKKLFSIGYEVYRVDKAPKKFGVNTVFYADGFAGEAEKITNSLGGKAVHKPLTWNSVFDIIVVTGLKR